MAIFLFFDVLLIYLAGQGTDLQGLMIGEDY